MTIQPTPVTPVDLANMELQYFEQLIRCEWCGQAMIFDTESYVFDRSVDIFWALCCPNPVCHAEINVHFVAESGLFTISVA